MKPFLDKLEAWLPTLISKKLWAFIVSLIAVGKSAAPQGPKAIAFAVLGALYMAAQAYVDAKK